jgi:hypothetical protein
MTEGKRTESASVSPLFEKMDALMRKHRGGTEVAGDIPVLTDEAPDAELDFDLIPVLTDELPAEALAFEIDDYSASAEPVVAPFLDLPLLDLDEIARSRSAHALPELDAAGVPLDSLVEEIELPPLELEPVNSGNGADEFGPAPIHEIEASPVIAVAEAAQSFGVDVPSQLVSDALGQEDALTLTELPVEPVIYTLMLDAAEPHAQADVPPPMPLLDAEVIAEITASVAAQVAVEVSTEVEQLARQHFAKMMSSFYSDSLRKITDEISRDLEMCLAPRIEELVQAELRRKGLAG